MDEKYYRKILKDELIMYRNRLNLDKNLTFGIEIEYENIPLDIVSLILLEEENNDLKNWINKSDLDISEYYRNYEIINGEISSPILTDSPKTWKNLNRVLNILNSKDAKITEKCGGHVNIGSKILEDNPIYYRNLFLLWALYSKYIRKFSSGEYNCLRKNLIVEEFNPNVDLVKNIKDFSDFPEELTDKFHEIYIEHKHEKRIEFRIPNGTLSEEIWQNYINFFAKLTVACKKELDLEKIVYKINNNDSNIIDFVDYIFEDDFDKEQFLIQALKTNKIYKKELTKHIVYI